MRRKPKDRLLGSFSRIADDVPQILWSADAEGSNDYVNQQLRDFVGDRINSVDADTWITLVHPGDRARVDALAKKTLVSTEPYEIEYRLLHHSGEYRWLRIKASPKLDENGRVLRWYGSSADIHDEKLAALLQEMVAGELEHRIKNQFALINGLISLSSREMPECKTGFDKLRSRISALNTAHQFIRNSETKQIFLNDLLGALFLPYARHGDTGQVSISGDQVSVDGGQTTAFTLIFHELATNSVKYGALSSPEGKASTHITRKTGEYVVRWFEKSAAIAARRSASIGFGSTLLGMAVEKQLGGRIARRQGSGYLCYIMRFRG